MSNIFSTSFGINFAKLTRVWLALILLTAKINSLLFLATLYIALLIHVTSTQKCNFCRSEKLKHNMLKNDCPCATFTL